MRRTQSLSITLPAETAEKLQSLVASGEYASESEVVEEGLRVLFEEKDHGFHNDAEMEKWLREEVVPVMDEMEAHPERLLTIDDVRRRIDALAGTLAVQQKRG